MKRAVVVYRSRTGTTRRLAEEIGAFLATRDVEPRVVSVGECDVQALADADYVLLGCWTSGLMVVAQHPDQPWIELRPGDPGDHGPADRAVHHLQARDRQHVRADAAAPGRPGAGAPAGAEVTQRASVGVAPSGAGAVHQRILTGVGSGPEATALLDRLRSA